MHLLLCAATPFEIAPVVEFIKEQNLPGIEVLITGVGMDLKQLSDLVNEKVLEKFDHKNLNLDTEEFRNLNPTAENIAVVIYDILRPHIKSSLDLYIRLYETPRNFVEYPA